MPVLNSRLSAIFIDTHHSSRIWLIAIRIEFLKPPERNHHKLGPFRDHSPTLSADYYEHPRLNPLSALV